MVSCLSDNDVLSVGRGVIDPVLMLTSRLFTCMARIQLLSQQWRYRTSSQVDVQALYVYGKNATIITAVAL